MSALLAPTEPRRRQSPFVPRFIRAKDAPAYLGMCRDEFNRTVRPHVHEFPIGSRGVGFDREELDAWLTPTSSSRRLPRPRIRPRIRRSERQGVNAMARKGITGLSQRNGIWHIDKKINGERLYESTGTGDRAEAERYLIHRLEKLRQEKVYGVRRVRIWREAATRYLLENKDQPSIELTATCLKQLDPFIGDVPLTHIDDESLAPFIKHRLEVDGVANRTVNIALERVIRVLSVSSRKWRDEDKRPWLDTTPMITRLDLRTSSRKPYPMSWEEQSLLFAELSDSLRLMALYKVNVGCREQEVCQLRWDWEIKVPEVNASVFLIPADFGGRSSRGGVKNRDDRLVILNDVAASVIDGQRGISPVYVFPYGILESR